MFLLALAAAISLQQGDGRDPNSSSYPFVPLQSVSTVHAAPDGNVTCSFSINGERGPGESCDFAGAAPEGLRSLRREATLTMAYSIIPAGASLEPDLADAGELIVESRARFEIAPDGRVAQCRQSAQRIIRRIAGVQAAPDLCRSYPRGHRLFEAADGRSPRQADFAVLVYFREGRSPNGR